jgi:hypothetical protein
MGESEWAIFVWPRIGNWRVLVNTVSKHVREFLDYLRIIGLIPQNLQL